LGALVRLSLPIIDAGTIFSAAVAAFGNNLFHVIGSVAQPAAGERRLLACNFRQLAENVSRSILAGRLPADTGWQPVLPGFPD
jgi:hypothetical protein